MPHDTEVGLSPGDFVLDGDPAPSPKRGQSPQISVHIYCDQTSGWINMALGIEVVAVSALVMVTARIPCRSWLPLELRVSGPTSVVSLPVNYTLGTSLLYLVRQMSLCYHTTTTILRPFFRDVPGEPVSEENFWTLWCKGKLTEADTLTIRLGATPSGLISPHFHHPPHILYRPDALAAPQPTVSKHSGSELYI